MAESKGQIKTSYWDGFVNFCAICSEAANLGIVLEIISRWWPALMVVGRGIFSTLVFISDPAIYFFKALNRLIHVIGRKYFGVHFAEDKHGLHPLQTKADIACMILFTLSIPMFLGLIITGPIGVTVGWILGLGGLCVTGYFDYFYQKGKAKETYLRLQDSYLEKYKQFEKNELGYEELIQARCAKDRAYDEYKIKRNSYVLYMGLLLGLALLLICGSLAVVAPPTIAPILFVISKVASGYLALIAAARFANWRYSEKIKKSPVRESTKTILQELSTEEERTPLLKPELKNISANKIVREYEHYKASKFFSPTSDESRALVQELKMPSGDVPVVSQLFAYLNEPQNQSKALYKIVWNNVEEQLKASSPTTYIMDDEWEHVEACST